MEDPARVGIVGEQWLGIPTAIGRVEGVWIPWEWKIQQGLEVSVAHRTAVVGYITQSVTFQLP